MPRSKLTTPLLVALAALVLGASAKPPAAPADPNAEWDRYLKRAEALRKFTDDDNLGEKDVLRVLRESGVFQPIESTRSRHGHRSFGKDIPKGFHPFTVRIYRGLWRWPLSYGVVSSEYGKRWGRRHHGIDIAADEGDKVHACAPGEVLYASSTLKGYGNVVILRHDEKTTSLYAHNTKLFVAKGEKIKLGQVIASVGSTGRSTGPHVHFEIRKSDRSVDPRKLLPKSRF